jgi:DNA-binding transcriptional regulator YhcF (GntR family)
MEWKFTGERAVYQQIVTTIQGAVLSGEYPPGGRIPPVRELAAEARVNPNTMQRAFAELERDGLVYTQRTSGRFVTEDAEVLKNLRKTLSEDVIEEMCTRLMRLGMSREEILSAVQEWAGEASGKTNNR